MDKMLRLCAWAGLNSFFSDLESQLQPACRGNQLFFFSSSSSIIMGIDLGYDLYPPLTLEDKPRWIQCLQFIAYHYKEDPKVCVKVDRIEFHVGEHPTLYFSTDKFRRFTSKVSGSGRSAEP